MALHLSVLLRAARVHGDIEVLGLSLLAILDAALVLNSVENQRVSLCRLANSWEDLVRRVVVNPPPLAGAPVTAAGASPTGA